MEAPEQVAVDADHGERRDALPPRHRPDGVGALRAGGEAGVALVLVAGEEAVVLLVFHLSS